MIDKEGIEYINSEILNAKLDIQNKINPYNNYNCYPITEHVRQQENKIVDLQTRVSQMENKIRNMDYKMDLLDSILKREHELLSVRELIKD